MKFLSPRKTKMERNRTELYEIMKDVIRLMEPRYIEVTGYFTPRGGISIWPYCNYGRPGTKYAAMAEQRMQGRDLDR